jgi:hypothetical protein
MCGNSGSTRKPQFPSEDDTWRKDLQQLVSLVRIATGSLILTLHEGAVTRIVVKAKIVLTLAGGVLDPRHPGEWTLCLRGLDRLVAAGLGQRLRSRVGPFGELRVFVEQGRLKEWRLSEKHK